MKKGFTLLELIIVIIIIGILATLGFSQYTKMLEKGRTAEARMILGQLRTAQIAYYQEHGIYTSTIADLGVDAPSYPTCQHTHYFSYGCGGEWFYAYRCISGGKTPNAQSSPLFGIGGFGGFGGGGPGLDFAYRITLDINGTFSGGPRAVGL